MTIIDLLIFITYLLIMLGVGFYFLRNNKDLDDYFVGGRQLGSTHVGLSVVATDVGGGFSIGLGGLGFSMGISGSWMLFTGLIGAWLGAVFLIPRVKAVEKKSKLYTFPQLLKHFYGKPTAMIATIITILGYIGFTASQLLAGAKLASVTFSTLDLEAALISMGLLVVVYTSLGGIKAVIYTDTIQWIILMTGLIFLGIPFAHVAVGGFQGIIQTLLNWCIAIIPIWFVGMTLYQRIYACHDIKTAQRAWYIAGLLEYPVMAFMGVLLGLYARVAFENGLFQVAGFAPGSMIDSEIGMPLLLKVVLPTGTMGLVLAAYFSAILSTADSCLMAASGSFINDVLKFKQPERALRMSQLITCLIGLIAIILAFSFNNVLTLMLNSYSFMVSGLFVPLIGGLFFERKSSLAAILSMLLGGGMTLLFNFYPPFTIPYGLDANLMGILSSACIFIGVELLGL